MQLPPGMVLPSIEVIEASIAKDQYLLEPNNWVEEQLGEHLWSKQKEIFNSVRDNRRTAVQSCHNMGKSFVSARIAAHFLSNHEPGAAFVVTSAPTFDLVRVILWKEIGIAHAKGALFGRLNQTQWLADVVDPKTGITTETIIAYGKKPSDVAPTSFQGIHAKFVLVIFDEACGIPEALWESADTLISNDNSRFLAIGNPDDPKTHFATVCKPGSGWNVIQISAFDTPNFTGEAVPRYLRDSILGRRWVKEKTRAWGKNNPLYISKILGQFPDVSEHGLVPLDKIRQAQEVNLSTSYPIEFGVDVGGGSDASVFCKREGDVARIVFSSTDDDQMITTGHLVRKIREHMPSRVKIDKIGIGAGLRDRTNEVLEKEGYTIQGINVGQPAKAKQEFVNLRSEAFWALRQRFMDGKIDIDPDDDDLAAQLWDMKFFPTSGGKLQIESKKDMKKRGVGSPDRADALMLAFLENKGRTGGATWGRKR